MFYATLKYFQVRKKVVDIETVEIYCYWIMGWKAFAVSVFIISISNTNTSFAISPEFNPWIQKNGIYLDHLEDLSTSTALNSIDKMIVTKRLLFLGEPDHYITEKLQYQYQLIKRYVSKGYHTLAIEMGRSDARRINKYLMTGDEEILKSVALFGNLSEVITQRDLPKGLLGTAQSDEIKKGKLQWIEGNKAFWRKIRQLNSTRTATQPPLQVFGIWMLYGGGSRGPGPECPQMECSIDLNNESLNAKFLKASPDKPVLVPMLGGLPLELKTPHDFQFNGVNINSTIFAEQANGVLFVPKVTPTKPF